MKTREAVDLQRPSGVRSLGHDKGKRRETRTGNCYSTAYPCPSSWPERCKILELRAEPSGRLEHFCPVCFMLMRARYRPANMRVGPTPPSRVGRRVTRS